MARRSINIGYPFKDSPKGDFLYMTTEDSEAIKSDLMHLILTQKGKRLYNPDFGTNLIRFIFEPNDTLTHTDLKNEIINVTKKYLPKLQIDEVVVEQSAQSEYAATVTIKYSITNDVFTETDILSFTV